MILFIYDHTFEGLLTCIFDAYFRNTFPDSLLMEGEPLPLFYDGAIHIATDEEKAGRVWRGVQKKISKHALLCPVSYTHLDVYKRQFDMLMLGILLDRNL